jgi:hypothetical protein
MMCNPQEILSGWSNEEEFGGGDMWQIWGRGEVIKGFGVEPEAKR